MGWGGAWRQEELKRFSSWVTTKVGLSLRAVGPLTWRVSGSRCNVGFCLWGQHLPSLFHHTSGSVQGSGLRVGRAFHNLGSTSAKTISKGLNKFCLIHFGGMQSK